MNTTDSLVAPTLRHSCLWLTLLGAWPLATVAQLQIVPDKTPPAVFAGAGRKILVVFHNPGDQTVAADLRIRLFQTSTATAMPLGEAPWKKLEVLAGQTVLETAPVDFPPVQAETRFLVQWVQAPNRVIGTTEVRVYPPDLLKELKPLAGDEPLGVFDPQNQLKPLLKTLGVEVLDLEDAGVEDFGGKLAIIGPFAAQTPIRDGLPSRIEALAKKGAAVVWMQPPPGRSDKLAPSFYAVPTGQGTVVIVQAGLVSNLPDSPAAQLHLIQMTRLAVRPEPVRLPQLPPPP